MLNTNSNANNKEHNKANNKDMNHTMQEIKNNNGGSNLNRFKQTNLLLLLPKQTAYSTLRKESDSGDSASSSTV